MMGLNDLFNKAETVFIGRVRDAAAPPDGVSGPFSVFRRVSYDVDGILKGSLSGASIDVFHYVVSDDRDRQPMDTTEPAVPFRRGARLLVFAADGPDPDDDNATQLEEIDSDDGVFELTPDLENRLSTALGGGAPSAGAGGGSHDLRIWLVIAVILAIAGWLYALF